MSRGIFIVLFFLCTVSVFSQNIGFQFDKGIDRVTIPFKLINNLIFIPIKVNGTELNMLLDSGVEETILFSLEDKKEVSFFNAEKIKLRGLGSEESIEGLKSSNNIISFPGLKSTQHLLYVIVDQSFNLSSHIGIPVNGILGSPFFKKNLIEINYARKKLYVYKDLPKYRNRIIKKFVEVPISIENSKPYVLSSVFLNNQERSSKLLIDIGNSDAVWLFKNFLKAGDVPQKSFTDYLGKGFSGDIEGDRARIPNFKLANFTFKNPIAAFPDSTSIKNVNLVRDRVGSVGGEIMKRFTSVFDYTNGQLYLRKNGDFNAPFTYNKSGVEVQHFGLQWVEENVKSQNEPIGSITIKTDGMVQSSFKYKFVLKPIYEIAAVRKNSPAALAGLKKGDIVQKINRNSAHNYTLQKLNELLKSDDGDWISFEIERAGQSLLFRFQLIDVL